MRSPAESLRRAWRIEGLLRGAALAALAVAVAASFWQLRRGSDVPTTRHAELGGAPDAVLRDSLAALARAGRAITWSGPLRAVMAVAEPLREPLPAWRIAAVGDSALELRDSLDVLDSLNVAGVVVTEPTRGAPQLREAASVALAGMPTPAAPQSVLVLGLVGWETRFAMAALEELGWSVDARLELGRGRSVTQGATTPNRARHGVVVVFDSATARRDAAALERFVRAGGGVILAGSAAASRALPARADSVILSRGDSSVVARARRVGRGRVLALPEAETWRWRMQGEGAAVEEHRRFWSSFVGMAAPAALGAPQADARASAPRAALTQALGPERPDARRSVPTPATLPWWLGPLILLALFAEWASRRRRGVP
ncbi:hypothetical protein Strain138_000766 [Pseudogemmatithrix spongiicola]|uniref:Uncharacterized protein n=1 Tax=Pseudogemmatithrix spongiicola TaxID=3062599 RepID=A0AA49JYS1_9BACT|nr:hypothetical protein Strain138_000766 [Gemmatimonadaceae bacterium 'strain 138']WKW14421.1 hypothetical protein Strain318_000766 [Gemmatimonadaceae bacterium 'strain 318']